MHSPTIKTKAAKFDKLYENVPPDQVARLKDFRLTHPYKHLVVRKQNWEYIGCGQGDHALLLLPGALSIAESLFPLIEAFENDYRIIAPSYPLSLGLAELTDGIAAILEREGLRKVNVVGGSYGGLVAQYFVRRHGDKVSALVLSHTFVLSSKYTTPLWVVAKLFPLLPRAMFAPLLRVRLNKILISSLRGCAHAETEFWIAYLNEAIASDLLKEVFLHQNKSLLACARQSQFTPGDLRDWSGRILIIESDNDPAIGKKDRDLLKRTYPEAQTHTFHNAGHASWIIERDEFVSVIRRFINSLRE